MSDDVFAEWKQNRFIIAPRELVDDGVYLIVLTDYRYWSLHTDELSAWCQARDSVTQGMTVVIKDEATLTEFVLRWS